MWMRIKESFYRFMSGRYGVDPLYRFLLVVYLVLLAVNLFLNSAVIYFLSLILLVLTFFRCFSRNIGKRQAENRRYLRIRQSVISFFKQTKNRLTDRQHVYRKCPSCRAMLRLPRKKGSHTVTCPRCGQDFGVKV